MRNPTYALAILLCAALAALMTGCKLDMSDPSPEWTTDYYILDTDGNEVAYLFPSLGKTNVRVTADGMYAFYIEDGEFTRFTVETGETQIFELPFDEQFYFDYWPSYTDIYLKMPINGEWGIFSIDVQTADVHALAVALVDQTTTYSVEYDRNEIYYVTNIDSISTIRRIDLATGVDDTLRSTSIGRYEYPAAAPDGSAFYCHFIPDRDSTQGLYRYSINSDEATCVTSTSSTWSCSIGVDDEFLVHPHGYAFINDDFNLYGHTTVGTACMLMTDRQHIAFEIVHGVLIYKDMISGEELRVNDEIYLNHWVSSEGYLVVISKTTISE